MKHGTDFIKIFHFLEDKIKVIINLYFVYGNREKWKCLEF